MKTSLTVLLLLSMLLQTTAEIPYTQPVPFAAGSAPRNVSPVRMAPRCEKYRVAYGSKVLEFNEEGVFRVRSNGQELVNFYLFFHSRFNRWLPVSDKKVIDRRFLSEPEKKRYTWSMKFPIHSNVSRSETAGYADYRQVLTVKGNRMIFEMEYNLPEGETFGFQPGHVSMTINTMVCKERKILMTGKKDRKIETLSPPPGKAQFLTLNRMFDSAAIGANDPLAELSISDFLPGKLQALVSKKQDFLFRLFFAEKQKKLTFSLDFGKVLPPSARQNSGSYGGIHFLENDALHVPDFNSPDNNLIQNSSFESGLRYYTVTGRFCARNNLPLEITGKEAKFGKRSLQMTIRRNDRRAGSFTTFAIPASKDAFYTLSFYAKAEKPGMLVKFFATTARWGTFPSLKSLRITPGKWQRYSCTFRQPNNGISITFGAEYTGSDPQAKIWFDGLKLEKSRTATNYIEPKLSVELRTSASDHFLAEGSPVNAVLHLYGRPGLAGNVSVTVRDCFHREFWKCTLPFSLGKEGSAALPLDLEKSTANGLYILTADFKFTDGSGYTDYFRFARMKFLDNTHRNKEIFGNQIRMNVFNRDKIMERMMRIGIGSTSYTEKQEDYELLKRYRVSDNGRGMAERIRIQGRETNPFKVGNRTYIRDFNKVDRVTPEIERLVEEGASDAAASSPWVEKWFLSGENGAGRYDLLLPTRRFKEFAKLLHAVYRGVKRFDPGKTVLLDGGPTNMNPVSGIRYIDDMLTACNTVDPKIRFDMLAIHPYRETPEHPDLDSDTAALLAVMKKHGYGDTPVLWNEGAYYTPYNLPEWGLNPHFGCTTDHYRLYSVSYDMGWGEYISAAYTARSWLVALKYRKNIHSLNVWSLWNMLDADLTPMQLQTVSNTLGQLLGNAGFFRDVRFAPQIRCYVFKDEQKRPVAALWSHIREVDHGREKAPEAIFNFNGVLESARDINNNQIASSSGTFAITSMPLFLIGKPGSEEKFCQALSEGSLRGQTALPLGIAIAVQDPANAKVTVTNLLDRPFRGEWDIAGKKWNLELPGAGKCNFRIPLPEPLTETKITSFRLPSVWKSGKDFLKQDFSFNGFLCGKVSSGFRYDDPAAWSAIPAIPLTTRLIHNYSTHGTRRFKVKHLKPFGTPGDLEAAIQTAWNDEHFFLCITVADDKFFPAPDDSKRTVAGGWNYDSIQLYFDTLCDARSRETRGHDGNDYNYDVIPVSENRAVVYRRIAPEQQLANGLLAPKPDMIDPSVQCKFIRLANGYCCRLSFPRRLLEPMQFETNGTIGFSIQVNDNDGEQLRSSLSLNNEPESCWMNPHLYPVMLLGKEKKEKKQ